MTDPPAPANAPLRWRRALVFAVVVGTLIFAIAWAPWALEAYERYRERKAAEPHAIAAIDAQQAAIVRGLLEGIVSWGDQTLPIPKPGDSPDVDASGGFPLLVDRTVQIPFDPAADPEVLPRPPPPATGDIEGAALYFDREFFRGIPLKFRQELVLANAHSTTQPDPLLPGVRLIGDGTRYIPWADFYAKHPDAKGVLKTSRAVLSADGDEALIYAWNGCGPSCDEGALFLLDRRAQRWTLRKILSFLGHTHLRCMPHGEGREPPMLVCRERVPRAP